MKKLEPGDVANILTFLSWHVPMPDVEPNEEIADCILCGKQVILDMCADALRESSAT